MTTQHEEAQLLPLPERHNRLLSLIKEGKLPLIQVQMPDGEIRYQRTKEASNDN